MDLALFLQSHPAFAAIFVILLIWEIIWKGIGLWKSAQNKDLVWFLAILIINSAGIIPLVYLFFFDKTNPRRARKVKKSSRRSG